MGGDFNSNCMERVSVPAGKNESTGEVLKGSLVMLMSVACGLSVANLYYSQPLLADIARDLHALEQNIGMIPMFTQIGYAIGMLVFVPLGDLYQRRTLIVVLLALVSGAL